MGKIRQETGRTGQLHTTLELENSGGRKWDTFCSERSLMMRRAYNAEKTEREKRGRGVRSGQSTLFKCWVSWCDMLQWASCESDGSPVN